MIVVRNRDRLVNCGVVAVSAAWRGALSCLPDPLKMGWGGRPHIALRGHHGAPSWVHKGGSGLSIAVLMEAGNQAAALLGGCLCWWKPGPAGDGVESRGLGLKMQFFFLFSPVGVT